VGQKIRREKFEKFGHVFAFEGFVEENSVDTINIGIDQCIKNQFVNLQSRVFFKYFQKY
jgi:hypothetical protein